MDSILSFDEDSLKLREFSNRLESFIKTEKEFVDGGLVLSLSSPFGTGKSTFLRMWQTSLEQGSDNDFIVIPLNAWESDYFDDPLYAIISSMLTIVDEKEGTLQKVSNAAKDLGSFSLALSSQLVDTLIGIDPLAAGEFAQRKRSQREKSKKTLNSFEAYEYRKKAMSKLKESISEYISTSGSNLLFLVDELDRCRPDYAISYLEVIKHIFDLNGAIFILAIDRHQLENSAKSEFGEDLIFDEYFRKFIQREINLPQITDDGYGNLSRKYVELYLQKEGLRTCFMDLAPHSINNIIELISGLKLTPRQTQEVFRILGHIFDVSADKQGRLRWAIALGTIVMAAFRIGSKELYLQLGQQKVQIHDITTVLRNLDLSDVGWWFMFFYSGNAIQPLIDNETCDRALENAGLTQVETRNISCSNLSDWSSGWIGLRSQHKFHEIYNVIEELMKWN